MKIAVVCDEKSIMKNEVFRSRIEKEIDCGTVCIDILDIDKIGVANVFLKLKELSPDILITTDLLGFEQATLTDNISYNLLDCKQIHLLLHDNLKNEHFLNNQLSIAMFFYCVHDEYCEYLVNTYKNLPYIQKISGWMKSGSTDMYSYNADIVCNIINDVINKCKIKDI